MQKKVPAMSKVTLVFALVGLSLVAGSAWAANPYEVTVERAVQVKMRDGVILRADIYRPKEEGKFPVLLYRTPYDKTVVITFGVSAASRGYVVISQDVRGRYTSEGEWYPFLHESDDGYDTVEWAASLPYSNGKVGMFGVSYDGTTQMLAAIAHPQHLAGICPGVTASNYHEGWTYTGGAFELTFNESWTSGLARNTLTRLVSKESGAVKGASTLPLTNYSLFVSPELEAGNPAASLAPYFLDWLSHPNYDAYWKRWSIEDHYQDIAVPALTLAGWYDLFQEGSLRNYMGMKAHAGNEAARKGQRLLVVIGGHAGGGQKVGDVDFGPAAARFDESDLSNWDWYFDLVSDWYDYLLKGVQNKFATKKPVILFVMGANQWREEDDWPLSRARMTKYYLHSNGKANSLRGSGNLSTVTPGSETFDQYVYDPANPAPTTGGPCCYHPGPQDQRAVENRDDVLVYSTAPFAHDVEVTGPVSIKLYAKSSSVDTDFTAKLVDIGSDGYAQNLTEGIIRARYRNSPEKPELLNPGEIYEFNINMWSTSNVFRKGHVLRLEVSSSNFPRFDRNLNTGEEAATAVRYVSATNAIYHDSEHQSALILPIVSTQ
jgi:putative CocE/NonD family hydrolase